MAHATVKLWKCIYYSICIWFVFCLFCTLVFIIRAGRIKYTPINLEQHYVWWYMLCPEKLCLILIQTNFVIDLQVIHDQ